MPGVETHLTSLRTMLMIKSLKLVGAELAEEVSLDSNAIKWLNYLESSKINLPVKKLGQHLEVRFKFEFLVANS